MQTDPTQYHYPLGRERQRARLHDAERRRQARYTHNRTLKHHRLPSRLLIVVGLLLGTAVAATLLLRSLG